MNFAFTTILVIFFLLPAGVFRRFYYLGQFSKQFTRSGFIELILTGFFASLILHTCWYYLALLAGYPVDFVVIGQFLTAKDFPSAAFQNLSDNFNLIVLYHITLFAAASALGFLCHKIIRHFKLDRQFKLFRFQNFWHYLIYGEFADFPRASFTFKNGVDFIEIRYVDALVELKEGSVLYEGILVDYELTKEGSLECIYLKDAIRRYLKDDPKEELSQIIEESSTEKSEVHYEIPGHVIILPYSKIVNINFTYCKLVKVDDSNTDEIEYVVELVE